MWRGCVVRLNFKKVAEEFQAIVNELEDNPINVIQSNLLVKKRFFERSINYKSYIACNNSIAQNIPKINFAAVQKENDVTKCPEQDFNSGRIMVKFFNYKLFY